MSPALSLPAATRFLGAIGWRLLLLLAAYSLFIQLVRPAPYLHNVFDQVWRQIAAEQLASHRPEAAGVIVGSSYSRMLGLDLPADFIDGGFFGGGPMTGNEILLRSGARPGIVLIEVNRIDRPLDEEIVREATAEPMLTLRRIFPALRFEYRPIRLLQSMTRKYGRLIGEKLHGKKPAASAPASTVTAADLPSNALPPPARLDDKTEAEILANFDLLRRQVDALRQRGVRVAFLHLPLSPAAEAAPVERFVTATAAERFPKDRYPWLDLPSDGTFRTYDGTHIPPGPESLRVAGIIVAWARAQLAEPVPPSP